jgi:hypothetical protein
MREVNIGSVSEFEDPGRKIFGFEGFEVASSSRASSSPISIFARIWADRPARAR